MKKIILTMALLLGASLSSMAVDVWRSSNAITTQATMQTLCSNTQRGIFHGVCTNFGVAGSSIAILSSATFTSGNIVGPITTLVADQCKYYDVAFSSGMYFFKNNAAVVGILYKCY